jgi:hypothetical protein
MTLLTILGGNVFAQCIEPDSASLRTTWRSFRSAALTGNGAQVEKFYKFPLILLPPMDGEKPARVTLKVFSKNYEVLFIKDRLGNEIELNATLKSITGNEYISPIDFSIARCALNHQVRIGDYNFRFDQKRGWLIESLYYGSDFDFMKKARLDRITQ